MSADEEIAQLRAEVGRLQSIVQQQAEQIALLTARLGKDSHNSSKPPASDGFKRRRQQRPVSERNRVDKPSITARRSDDRTRSIR